MNVFKFIKDKKREHEQKKRANVQSKLKDLKQELEVINKENKIINENKRLVNEYKNTRKAVFEAKHPFLNAGVKKIQKNIKENKKKGKGVFAQNNTSNPFVNYQPNNPFDYSTKKRKK